MVPVAQTFSNVTFTLAYSLSVSSFSLGYQFRDDSADRILLSTLLWVLLLRELFHGVHARICEYLCDLEFLEDARFVIVAGVAVPPRPGAEDMAGQRVKPRHAENLASSRHCRTVTFGCCSRLLRLAVPEI